MVCRSRVKRQQWEQENALQEKQKRIQAIHDSQETEDTQETQVQNIWVFSPLVPSKREKNILSLSQFVYFLREVCLLFIWHFHHSKTEAI